MPQFGIVTSSENASAVRSAGFDFIEEFVRDFLRPDLPDEEWEQVRRSTEISAVRIPSGNSLLPAGLKVCGPAADPDRLADYLDLVFRRAQQVGMKTIVFGSGAARTVPDGFDREKARQQIMDFLGAAVNLAAPRGITLVVEPLNRSECNIINTVAEAMQYVLELNHPNLQCLVDSYHLWLEDEPLDNVRRAMPWIRHVHLADTQGRAPCGKSGRHDYPAFFRVLKNAGYDGLIAVESPTFFKRDAIERDGARVLEFLRESWTSA